MGATALAKTGQPSGMKLVYVDPDALRRSGVSFLRGVDDCPDLEERAETAPYGSVLEKVWGLVADYVQQTYIPEGVGREAAVRDLIIAFTDCYDTPAPGIPSQRKDGGLYHVLRETLLSRPEYSSGVAVTPSETEHSIDVLLDRIFHGPEKVDGAMLIENNERGSVRATHALIQGANTRCLHEDLEELAGHSGYMAAIYAAAARPFSATIKISANTGRVELFQKLPDKDGGRVARIRSYDPETRQTTHFYEPITAPLCGGIDTAQELVEPDIPLIGGVLDRLGGYLRRSLGTVLAYR